MRRGIPIAILALAVLVPGSGRAAEATFAVEVGAQYDTNVFSTPTNLIDDVSFRPAVEVGLKADPSSDFQWSLKYRPDYQAYVSTHGINGFDHLAQANLDYHISSATDVYLKEQFQRVLSLTDREQFLASDSTVLGQPSLILGREAIDLNDLQTGVTHNFSPRLQGGLTLSNSLYYPEQKNVSDATTSGATGDLIYALTPRDRIGSSLGFTYQQLSSTDVQPRTSTRYYQLDGIWIHDFSPTLQLDMRAGPAWVDPSNRNITPQPLLNQTPVPLVRFGNEVRPFDVRTCPTKNGNILLTSQCQTLGPLTSVQEQIDTDPLNAVDLPVIPGETGGSNGGLTYFAAITLAKHWERWDASLTYTRDSGASSSFNQSSILDTVQGGLHWHPSELWNLSLSASWSRRTSASDQPQLVRVVVPLGANAAGIDPNAAANTAVTTVRFSNAIDVDTYVAYLRVDRRITRRASVFGVLLFVNQNDNGAFSSSNDFTDYRAQLGFRYEFEPLPLAL